MGGLSRRTFLQLSGLALAGGTTDDPFAPLRRRWRDATVPTPPKAAVPFRDGMVPTDRSLWPDLPFPSLTATPERLLTMARAHAATGDPTMAAAVHVGLDHYTRLVYTPDADGEGNWWDWQIGAPKRLLDAAVLTGYQGQALLGAVDRFVPESRLGDYSGTSTGANRVDLCTVMLLRAILGADRGRAALASGALAPAMAYVTEGDGLHRDGSFIQHSHVPYQGGYGAVWLAGLAVLFAVLDGSPWAVRDKQVVFDSVEWAFAPFVHEGRCMDLVRGRAIDRAPHGDLRSGNQLASAIILLGQTASVAERSRWRRLAEGWDQPAGHRLFPASARAVHRREGWCAALSMASARVGHYEHGNGENLRGWHTGSGMLYWWGDGHGDHYSDFWTTVDPSRLPGTTASRKVLPDGAGKAWGDTCPPARWVGGATDGHYATVGQHLNGLESTLDAFKSWFFLDDAVVCMGAGITCQDGAPVETIIDNRKTTTTLTVEPGWAHLEGHGGYVLPCTALHTGRERGHTMLWLDHGPDPDGSSYLYQLLPGATRAQTKARADHPEWVHVLANTSHQQGIHVPDLGVTAINFWQPGTAGPVTADAPCAVLIVKHPDGRTTVTAADPRGDLADLTITLDGRPLTFDTLPKTITA